MREVHLRDVDLNLLHALRALLEERHVTRAAKRCFLSQPAMSRALERLREMFGDVLLVRSGRAYERTVRGERVLRELESLMPRLEAMVRGESFEPVSSALGASAPSVETKIAAAIGKSVRRVFTLEPCKPALSGACRT